MEESNRLCGSILVLNRANHHASLHHWMLKRAHSRPDEKDQPFCPGPGTPLHSVFPADISRREDGSEGSKRSDALAIVCRLDARAISEHSDSPGSVIDGGEYQQPWKSKTHKLAGRTKAKLLPTRGIPATPRLPPWLPPEDGTGEGKKLNVRQTIDDDNNKTTTSPLSHIFHQPCLRL